MSKFNIEILTEHENFGRFSQEEMDSYKSFMSNIKYLIEHGWKHKSRQTIAFKQNNPWMPEDIDYDIHVDLDLDMSFDGEKNWFMEPKWRTWVDLGDLLVTESIRESLGYKESEKDRWIVESRDEDLPMVVYDLHEKVMRFMTSGTLEKLVNLQRERKQIDDQLNKIIG